MDALNRDLRYAFRMLWKTPALSLVAISILAMGIGANIAIALAGALAVLALIAISAAWIPARRATKVDPIVALH